MLLLTATQICKQTLRRQNACASCDWINTAGRPGIMRLSEQAPSLLEPLNGIISPSESKFETVTKQVGYLHEYITIQCLG